MIKLSYLIFLSYVHSRLKFKALITKKHKAIGFSIWVHQVFPINRTMLSTLSRKLNLQSNINTLSLIYTYELHFRITHSLFKRISQICSKVHQISLKKTMVICSRQNAHQLNTSIRNLVMVLKKKGGRISTHALCLTTNS